MTPVEWDHVLTVAGSAIAGAGVIVNGYIALMRYWRDGSQQALAESARWSLNLIAAPRAEGWLLASLRRQTVGAPAVYLIRVTILAPRGAKLAPTAWSEKKKRPDGGYNNSELIPQTAKSARALDYGRDLDPARRVSFHAIENLDHAKVSFFVSPPESRRSAAATRFSVLVEAEEISSARRSIRVKVKTRPIALTANKGQAES